MQVVDMVMKEDRKLLVFLGLVWPSFVLVMAKYINYIW